MGAESLRVILRRASSRAPRMPSRTGARVRWSGSTHIAVMGMMLCASPVDAQEPPDSLQLPDSLTAVDSLTADSLAVDSLGVDQEADSVSADTIFYNMPSVRDGLLAGFATGIWEWDRHLIMASGANTVAELFEEVPGLITLLAGDFGTPAAVTAFGQGGAGYRVIRDGFELFPLDGGVPDLQRIGLAGITRVRLDRSLGQMRIELWSHEYVDGRPFSVVEAGTGDLDTNMFRGVYADPRALGGSIAVGMERIDTRGRGPTRDEGGNRTGSWLRYQVHLRDRAAIGVEYRRMGTQTKVPILTPSASRSDVVVKAGWNVLEGVTLEGFTGTSSSDADVGEGIAPVGGKRRQYGSRLGLDFGGLWANGAIRLFQGDLPANLLDASGGFTSDRWGGAAVRVGRSSWNDVSTSNMAGRGWLTPIPGVTLFGAYEAGTFGSRDGPVADAPPPIPRIGPVGVVPGTEAITDRTTFRAGALVSRWGVTLGGATLYTDSDLALPLGTELSTGSTVVAGAARTGFEGTAVLPTMWEGMTLQGSYQAWSEPGPYLPGRIYRGSFEFHSIRHDTGNLEFWGSLGVRGHDPMDVFVPVDGLGGGPLAGVPFYQSWYFRVQVRIVTVRLYLGMDNISFRRQLQNYPDRLLPYGRSFFALRWDLWN